QGQSRPPGGRYRHPPAARPDIPKRPRDPPATGYTPLLTDHLTFVDRLLGRTLRASPMVGAEGLHPSTTTAPCEPDPAPGRPPASPPDLDPLSLADLADLTDALPADLAADGDGRPEAPPGGEGAHPPAGRLPAPGRARPAHRAGPGGARPPRRAVRARPA